MTIKDLIDYNSFEDTLDLELKDFNDDQKKALRGRFSNISLPKSGVKYNDDDDSIVFLSEKTFNNWNYYAGFEYIKPDFLFKDSRNFIAIFSGDERVDEILDIIGDLDF